MKTKLFAAVIGLGLVPAAASAAVIVVDDFASAAATYPLVASVVPVVVAGAVEAAPGAVGGTRQATAQLHSAAIAGLDSLAVGVFPVGPGVFDYSSTSGADGAGSLLYGANIAGGSSLNLAIPDASTLDLDVLLFDRPQGGSLTITVFLNNGVLSGSTSSVVVVGGPQLVSINLDSIPLSVRSNVTGLTVSFDGTNAVDFRLDDISVVIPEPSALGLLAPAGLLLARRRR